MRAGESRRHRRVPPSRRGPHTIVPARTQHPSHAPGRPYARSDTRLQYHSQRRTFPANVTRSDWTSDMNTNLTPTFDSHIHIWERPWKELPVGTERSGRL